ncbi:MAG: hypothetical protein WCE98_09620 [Chlorobium sp.]|jgi:hypothetical protein
MNNSILRVILLGVFGMLIAVPQVGAEVSGNMSDSIVTGIIDGPAAINWINDVTLKENIVISGSQQKPQGAPEERQNPTVAPPQQESEPIQEGTTRN